MEYISFVKTLIMVTVIRYFVHHALNLHHLMLQ